MSKLTIKDLETSKALDREAASVIFGGINEWIQIPTSARPMIPMALTNIINIDNDITLVNPQYFTFGNGVQNTGTISYNLSPMLVNAASPTYVVT